MHRFFVPPESILDGKAILSGDQAHQIARVLRQAPGDGIILLDNTGHEYDVTLTAVSPKLVEGDVTGRRLGLGEPDVKITLYQAMLKSDRFELVLQKCAELGVSTFVPIITERTVVRASEGQRASSRLDRWRRILIEAAEQSRRARIPVVAPPISFEAAVQSQPSLAVMPWEEDRSTNLRDVISESEVEGLDRSEVSIIIGPEGGFTAEEADLARRHGVQTVSLGRRILRAETAAIAAVAAVIYELGEWDL
ncbi:MAG: 16S rRNA (uracil(1498)-N(3))-methyltransferase [SAR202 cluster bacterium]|jgi:16S rRNA (uracil1498-N3)-methyltransferase|nr:16S rRNA (uracil(1498)-N(3))-methyltransferase [SAR202 cluster bacterium]MDP6714011.1 16S rRNA (uracil(1498)-N(3))-methyltransferase [SAR202 cluster bacterium]